MCGWHRAKSPPPCPPSRHHHQDARQRHDNTAAAEQQQREESSSSIFPERVHVITSVTEWANLREEAVAEGFLLATVFLSAGPAIAAYWPAVRRLVRVFGGPDVRFVFVEVCDGFYQRVAAAELPCSRREDPRDPRSAWSAGGASGRGVDLDVALCWLSTGSRSMHVPGLVVGGGRHGGEGEPREFTRELTLDEFTQTIQNWVFLNRAAAAPSPASPACEAAAAKARARA